MAGVSLELPLPVAPKSLTLKTASGAIPAAGPVAAEAIPTVLAAATPAAPIRANQTFRDLTALGNPTVRTASPSAPAPPGAPGPPALPATGRLPDLTLVLCKPFHSPSSIRLRARHPGVKARL